MLIAGDGLGYVPWHAARTTGLAGTTRFACEDFAFSYAASARQLAAVVRLPERTPRDRVALVANPTGDLPSAAAKVATLRTPDCG